MILGLDIDGVVADFLSPFLQSIEQKMGTGPIPPQSITDAATRTNATALIPIALTINPTPIPS